MSYYRSILRSFLPNWILEKYRSRKKIIKNKQLFQQQKEGKVITRNQLISDLEAAGILLGDNLMVHSSLSKIGFVENGPQTVVEALLEVIGPTGHLLMPNSPNASFQLDYIKQLEEFNVLSSPSKLGAISEFFRVFPGTKRSAHPTEPVSCYGPDKDFFVDDHFGNLTPYDKNSPYFKLIERKGKILYLGVTLENAGTHLHTLEDAVEKFKFPVYHNEIFEVKVIMADGTSRKMKTKVHNPEQSKKRRCDDLIPLFEREGVLRKVKIGQADALIVDGEKMFQCMLEQYEKNGVTMYTPFGS
jgi:aminoglycoside 3-N-acetyltransferase